MKKFKSLLIKKKKTLKQKKKCCQLEVCTAFVIQSDLATNNLSLSPEDWISSFPLKERERGRVAEDQNLLKRDF